MEVESVAEVKVHDRGVERSTGVTTAGNVSPSIVASGGGEAMVTETTGDNGGQSTAHTMTADVEMESGKMAGNVSRVGHDGIGAPRGVAGRAHEVADVSHEMASVDDEMSSFSQGVVDNARENDESDEHAMTGVAHEVTNVARAVTNITHGISSDAHETFEIPREGSGIGNETRVGGDTFPTVAADRLFGVSHESLDAERDIKNANFNVGADVRSDIDGKMENKHHVGIDGDFRGDEMHIAKTKNEPNEKDLGTKGIDRDTLEATEHIRGSEGDDLQAPEGELDTLRGKETGTGDTNG